MIENVVIQNYKSIRVQKANSEENLASRYVHVANFENAHGYNLLS